MSSIVWWRSWHGAPTDNKWLLIASKAKVKPGIVSAVAWALMDYASQHQDRGSVVGFDAEVYAAFSGFDEAEINAVIQSMNEKGIIADGRFVNWEKRQPKREDETSTQRVRDWREKKRIETQCNTPDKDTDKEKEEVEEGIDATPASPAEWMTPQMEAQKVIQEVTGLLASPPQEIEKYTELILRLKDKYNGKTVEYLKPFYVDWCGRKTKEGKPYKRTMLGWLEWALEGAAPQAPVEIRRRRKVEE